MHACVSLNESHCNLFELINLDSRVVAVREACVFDGIVQCTTVIHLGGSPIKYASKGVIEIASKPREARNFNGVDYIMEEAITGNYALIKVCQATCRNACIQPCRLLIHRLRGSPVLSFQIDESNLR